MKLLDVGVEPVGVVAIGVLPRGVLAIGPMATGVIAIGQVARGFIAIGQLALGVIVIGQLGVGMWWASAQLALAPIGGPAMLRIAPYGTLYPGRRRRGEEDWRNRGPEYNGWRRLAAILFVIAIGALVWFVAIIPVRDLLFGPGGVF
ncbi:MAG: hypothetical protein MUP76_10405 [Acidimicrobiia bacterium]|nr:hypothetical protein [Acidimicrobiia bacterium]